MGKVSAAVQAESWVAPGSEREKIAARKPWANETVG